MATVINISNRIKDEEKFIAYNGKNYKVDDSMPTVLAVQESLAAASAENNLSAVRNAIVKLLGKEAAKDFDKLAVEDYTVPFYAAMACINGKSYEETEEMFRNAAGNG